MGFAVSQNVASLNFFSPQINFPFKKWLTIALLVAGCAGLFFCSLYGLHLYGFATFSFLPPLTSFPILFLFSNSSLLIIISAVFFSCFRKKSYYYLDQKILSEKPLKESSKPDNLKKNLEKIGFPSKALKRIHDNLEQLPVGTFYFDVLDNNKENLFCEELSELSATEDQIITIIKSHSKKVKLVSKPFYYNSKLIRYEFDLFSKKISVNSSENLKSSYEKTIYLELKNSPYIVRCLSCATIENELVFKFEYCNGGTLANSQRKISFLQELQIFADCLNGLHLIHKKKFIHCDLNLGNLFIHNLRGRLGDFGNALPLAKIIQPGFFSELLKDVRWTANRDLFSPEILKAIYQVNKNEQTNNIAITEKTDVWSFGLVMALYFYEINLSSLKLSQLEILPPYLKFLKMHMGEQYIPEEMTLSQQKKNITLHSHLCLPPSNVNSLDFILWKMLHPMPECRPSAKQAALFIQRFIE